MAEEKENGEKEKTLLDYAIDLSPEAALIAGLTEEQQKALISRAARNFGKVYPRSYDHYRKLGVPAEQAVVMEAADAERNRQNIQRHIQGLDESLQDSWLLSNAEGDVLENYDHESFGVPKGTFYRPSTGTIYVEPYEGDPKKVLSYNGFDAIHEGTHRMLHDIALHRDQKYYGNQGLRFFGRSGIPDVAKQNHGFVKALDDGVRNFVERGSDAKHAKDFSSYRAAIYGLVPNFENLDESTKLQIVGLLADEYGLSPSNDFQFPTGHDVGYKEQGAFSSHKFFNGDYRKNHASQAGEGGAQLAAVSSSPSGKQWIMDNGDIRNAYDNLLMAIDDDERPTPQEFLEISPSEYDEFDPKKVVKIQDPYGGYNYYGSYDYKKNAERLGRKRIQVKAPYRGTWERTTLLDGDFEPVGHGDGDFEKRYEMYVKTPYGRKGLEFIGDALKFREAVPELDEYYSYSPQYDEESRLVKDEYGNPVFAWKKYDLPKRAVPKEWLEDPKWARPIEKYKKDYELMKKIHADRQKAVDFKKVLKKIK